MVKKLISLLIVLAMMFSLVAYASEDTDFVKLLGGYEFESEKFVTRGEFVYATATLFAKGFSLEKTKTEFYDVSASNQFSGAIDVASKLGWVSGYGDGNFGIKDKITFTQALAVILRALGYEQLKDSFGGYVSLGNYIGITDGVELSSEYLKGKDVATLLRNALEANALVQTGFGDELSWKADGELSNLKQFLNIEVIEGIVTDNGVSSLLSTSDLKEGQIKIDETVIDAQDSTICNCLGYNVRAFVNMDSSLPLLVYYEIDETKTFKIPASAVESVDTKSVIYIDSHGKEKTARISNVADYIYNGMAYTDCDAQDLAISDGFLTFVDNNGDSVADIVCIEESKNAVVSDVKSDKSRINTLWGEDITIDDDAFVTVIKGNKKISLDEIKGYNVLTVYESKDACVITIYVSDKVFRGCLTGKNISNNRETIFIDNEEYVLKNADLYDSLELGKEYEFCSDIYGNIVYTKDNFEYRVGLLVDAKIIKNSLNSESKIKLFTSDGKMEIYSFAEKVKFCGKSVNAETAISNLDFSQYLVVGYNIGSDGRISELVLESGKVPAEFSVKENFKMTYTASEISYQAQQKSFEGKIMANNATKVFLVPFDKSDESGYYVSDISVFVSGIDYNVSSYIAGEDDWYADYIVSYVKNEFSKTHGAILVDYVGKALNNDGEETEILGAYNEKGEVEYVAAKNFSFEAFDIGRGDIIRCVLNPFGEVCGVRKVFSASDFKFVNDGGAAYSAQPRFIHGYVYEKNRNLVSISFHPNIPPEISESNMEIHDFSGMKIYEFDSGRDRISVINVDMLTDYMTDPGSYSKIFYYTQNSAPRFAVSYK
ncbi:MAG: S-layer homology domain-containing protein [Clostridia bacterium]|nr:S-layer homology domain-containing protein [Clostridia bacterium]